MVDASSVLGNDSYQSSWESVYWNPTEWNEPYWEEPVWHDAYTEYPTPYPGYWEEAQWNFGHCENSTEWHAGYWDPPVWHPEYVDPLEPVPHEAGYDPPEAIFHEGYWDGEWVTTTATMSFSVTSPPAHGSLSLSSDGGFVYTPDPNYSGPDGFSYEVHDGQCTGSASVNITERNKGVRPHY